MASFEEEIKRTFLQEAQQLLESAENDCLDLSKGSYSEATIDRLFRVAHTFKGSANAVGFEALSGLAHQFESVLDKILKKELKVGATVCAGILETI